jgi:hypothetical protein
VVRRQEYLPKDYGQEAGSSCHSEVIVEIEKVAVIMKEATADLKDASHN